MLWFPPWYYANVNSSIMIMKKTLLCITVVPWHSTRFFSCFIQHKFRGREFIYKIVSCFTSVLRSPPPIGSSRRWRSRFWTLVVLTLALEVGQQSLIHVMIATLDRFLLDVRRAATHGSAASCGAGKSCVIIHPRKGGLLNSNGNSAMEFESRRCGEVGNERHRCWSLNRRVCLGRKIWWLIGHNRWLVVMPLFSFC